MHSGDAHTWYIASVIEQFQQTRAIVTRQAISAGLTILLACDERIAIADNCYFAWHGSMHKPGLDSSRMSDEKRIDWITERTKAPRDFWAEKAESGETFGFHAEEALELGVIQRIERMDEHCTLRDCGQHHTLTCT